MMFRGELVRAILSGRKTETRRLLVPSAVCVVDRATGKRVPRPEGLGDLLTRAHVSTWERAPSLDLPLHPHLVALPRVQAGDALWVRETWGPCDVHADGCDREDPVCVRYAADGAAWRFGGEPGGVPLETTFWPNGPDGGKWRPAVHLPRWACRLVLPVVEVRVERLCRLTDDDARAEGCESCDDFARLWDSLAPAGATWAANPLVLVYRWEPVGGARE